MANGRRPLNEGMEKRGGLKKAPTQSRPEPPKALRPTPQQTNRPNSDSNNNRR